MPVVVAVAVARDHVLDDVSELLDDGAGVLLLVSGETLTLAVFICLAIVALAFRSPGRRRFSSDPIDHEDPQWPY